MYHIRQKSVKYTKDEMRKTKKGNDLYIITSVAENYSFLSDGRVVGAIDVIKV